MFGSFRLVLALLVVVSHLSGAEHLTYVGYYAVRGFFVLSGFVITSALHDVYEFDAARFWFNRMLRIVPLYYIVALLTMGAIEAAPALAADFAPFWANPSAGDLTLNAFLLPLQFGNVHFRLVMPAWSVAVEVVLYFLLWAAIARREAYAWIALAAAFAYHGTCLFDGLDWTTRYFPFTSACLSFSLGALIFFLRRRNQFPVRANWLPWVACAWALNLLAATHFNSEYVLGLGYYLNVVLCVTVVSALSCRVPNQLDKALGDLAYPIFLNHWLAAFVVALITSHYEKGWLLLLLAMPVILLGAHVLARLNAAFIEPLRDRVRMPAAKVIVDVAAPIASRSSAS